MTQAHLKTIYVLGSARNRASVWPNDHWFSPRCTSPALALIVSSVEMIKPTTDPAGSRRQQRNTNRIICAYLLAHFLVFSLNFLTSSESLSLPLPLPLPLSLILLPKISTMNDTTPIKEGIRVGRTTIGNRKAATVALLTHAARR